MVVQIPVPVPMAIHITTPAEAIPAEAILAEATEAEAATDEQFSSNGRNA